MIRRLFVLAVIVGVAYPGAEFAAKRYVETKIEQEVRDADPSAQDVTASVSWPVIYDFASAGVMSETSVSVRRADIGPFVADLVTATFERVHLDRAESIRGRKPVVASIERLRLAVEVTSAELSKIVPDGFSFQLENGSVTLRGPGIEVRGRFEVLGEDRVRFAPERGGPLPMGVGFRVEGVPFANCLEAIFIDAGRARFECSVDDPPARLTP